MIMNILQPYKNKDYHTNKETDLEKTVLPQFLVLMYAVQAC